MILPKEPPGFDTSGFSRLPILVNGRVMPADTLARLTLLVMNIMERVQLLCPIAALPCFC